MRWSVAASIVCAVVSVACSTSRSAVGHSDAAVSRERSAPEHDAELAGNGNKTETGGPALTREEIRMVVRAKLPQIRACFEAGLSHTPELGGRVLLRFAINAEGKAENVAVLEDQLADPAVAACIVAALPTWQFPRPRDGQPIVISYPFAFSSEQSLRAAGLPRVEGTVKPQAVGAVFDARRSELDVCVPAGASGSIGVAFTIDDAGAVTRISKYDPAGESDLGPERSEGVGARAGAAEHDPSPARQREEATLPDDAGDCVTRTISSWVFPPAASDDEARVNHDLQW